MENGRHMRRTQKPCSNYVKLMTTYVNNLLTTKTYEKRMNRNLLTNRPAWLLSLLLLLRPNPLRAQKKPETDKAHSTA